MNCDEAFHLITFVFAKHFNYTSAPHPNPIILIFKIKPSLLYVSLYEAQNEGVLLTTTTNITTTIITTNTTLTASSNSITSNYTAINTSTTTGGTKILLLLQVVVLLQLILPLKLLLRVF